VKVSEVAKDEILGSARIRNDAASGHRILVVDDNNYLRRLCVKTLVKAAPGARRIGEQRGSAMPKKFIQQLAHRVLANHPQKPWLTAIN
jgi:hypothetical protein